MEQETSPLPTEAPERPDQASADRRAERAQRHAAALEANHLLAIRTR
jgi:hypothetical protein